MNSVIAVKKGVTSNVIDRQKLKNMKKERNLYRFRDYKRSCYCCSLFLLLLFMTSCKSNRFVIDSNEVENVNFWFIGDVDTSHAITDCIDIVLME